ncbi:unnamed protein product [Pleuronectes platessa]|uniref:Uncharacterized protein n=1 Tax=Pleuronectes platessa TaxID=8262 RepID=A0A9N7YG88_PLEPL|nr:unnamed protein product [Pleuronectes platessa]
MRVNIAKDNPNMTCQAVPLQSQSMVSNQQDHDPPSRPERHSSPQSPSTAARTRCQRDTGSAITTTISPHDTESATLDPPPQRPMRDPQTAIHGAATEALDLRVIKQRDSGEEGWGWRSWKEKLLVSCVINSLCILVSSGGFCLVINDTMIQAELGATLRLKVNLTGYWFVW